MAETASLASNLSERGRACGDTHKRAAFSRSERVSCEMPLCNKNPSFAYMGEKRRRFCKHHAEPGMVNAYYKYCDAGQCRERATFESSEGKVWRCLVHRESGMVPRSKICQVEGGGCARQSSYGPEGSRPVLCTIHKLPGMVQVRSRTCKQPGCTKIPSYGFLCKSRDYCKAHAQEGMVYYSAGSKCQYRGCGTPGMFNHLSARGGSFCSRHKQEGMVDVSRRTCEEIGCIYKAKYGYLEQRTKRFCARHKLEGMLTLEDMGKQMDAGDKTPPDFRSGIGEMSTSRGFNDGGGEESGSIDTTRPGSASSDATTVETNKSVPGTTRPRPRTTNTKEFTEARKRALLRRLAPALSRGELSSGFSPIPLPLAPLFGSRATAAGVLFPGLILPGLAEVSSWNSVLVDTHLLLLSGYFASAANVKRMTSEPFSPVLGPALRDVACLAAAAEKMAPMKRASTTGATGSSISNGVSCRNPRDTNRVSPDLRMPGASTVSQAQVHITPGRDSGKCRDTVSSSETYPEHTCLPGTRAGVSIHRERNRPKEMDDDSFLVCLIDSMDPADLKSDDLKGAVLSRLRRVKRMVDR